MISYFSFTCGTLVTGQACERVIPLKSKKFASGAALLLALVLTLSGCGSLKTAHVASKFGAAIKRQPVTAATAEITGNIVARALGIEAKSNFRVEAATKSDGVKSYSDVKATINLLGIDLPQTLQAYAVPDGENTIRYFHVDGFNLWFYTREKQNAWEVDPSLLMLLVEKAAETSSLETRESDQEKTYVLSLTFRAEDLRELAVSAGAKLTQEFLDCDLSMITLPLTIELDGKTYLPKRMELKILGLNSAVLAAAGDAFGHDLADVELGDVTLVVSNFAYGPQTIPELPQEAAEKAVNVAKLQPKK